MTKSYGVPYQGSKNALARRIVDVLPPGDVFYDLFAGGCAVTHAAMESGKYRRFVANDLDGRGVRLFVDAAAGKYRDERRLVDRAYFNANKDTDPYVSLCWSFGGDGHTYLWGPDRESLLLAACRIVTGETMEERREAYMAFMGMLLAALEGREGDGGTLLKAAVGSHVKELHAIESLGRLHAIERLGRLHAIGRLGRLHAIERLAVMTGDYRAVDIEAGGVVYCDPPYKGTAGYRFIEGGFDHGAFHEWLRGADFPVWVSEYAMPADFVCVRAFEHVNRMSGATGSRKSVERLFLHRKWAERMPAADLFGFEGV